LGGRLITVVTDIAGVQSNSKAVTISFPKFWHPFSKVRKGEMFTSIWRSTTRHLQLFTLWVTGILALVVAGCTSPLPASTPTPSKYPPLLIPPPPSSPSSPPNIPVPPALTWNDGALLPENLIFLHYRSPETSSTQMGAIVIVWDNSQSFVRCVHDLEARNKLVVSLLQTALVWAKKSGAKVYFVDLRKGREPEPINSSREIKSVTAIYGFSPERSATPTPTPYSVAGTESWESLADHLQKLAYKVGKVEAVVITDGWFADAATVPNLSGLASNVQWVPVIFAECEKPLSQEPSGTAKFWRRNLPTHHGILLEPKQNKWWGQIVENLKGVHIAKNWQEAFKYLVRDGLFPGVRVDMNANEATPLCSRMRKEGDSVPGGVVCNATYSHRAGYGLPIDAGASSEMAVFSDDVLSRASEVDVYEGRWKGNGPQNNAPQVKSLKTSWDGPIEKVEEDKEYYGVCGAKAQAYWWLPQSLDNVLGDSTLFFLQIDSPMKWEDALRASTLKIMNTTPIKWQPKGELEILWQTNNEASETMGDIAASDKYAPCYEIQVRASQDKRTLTLASWSLGKEGNFGGNKGFVKINASTYMHFKMPLESWRDVLPWGNSVIQVCLTNVFSGTDVACSPKVSVSRSCNSDISWQDLQVERESNTQGYLLALRGREALWSKLTKNPVLPRNFEMRALLLLGYSTSRFDAHYKTEHNYSYLTLAKLGGHGDASSVDCKFTPPQGWERVLKVAEDKEPDESWVPYKEFLGGDGFSKGEGRKLLNDEGGDECVREADKALVVLMFKNNEVGSCKVLVQCPINGGSCSAKP